MTRSTTPLAVTTGLAGALLLSACGGSDPVEISGSTTVAPVTALAAREAGVDIDQAEEGTVAGFERFCEGQTPINNASEAIPGAGQPVDYVQLCADNGVDFVELPIGLDALSLVRHVDNDRVEDLTLEELRAIWAPDSEVTTWSDVRPEWPEEEIVLVGRPAESGTFEYFTHHVTGEVGAIRDDYRTTHDLDELAGWIAEEPYALGFMGAGNYLSAPEESRDRLTTVAVDGVEPGRENAQDGSYAPLTRPLFLYVSLEALEDEEIESFVTGYVEQAASLMPRTYFYALSEDTYAQVEQRLADRVTGSVYEGDPYRSEPVGDLLGR